VRNVATVGGALAHADPHMDLPPLFAALGARATIAGPAGERSIPVDASTRAIWRTRWRATSSSRKSRFPRWGNVARRISSATTRSADDWPAVGIAVLIDGDDVRIVLGAATDSPRALQQLKKFSRGRPTTRARWKRRPGRPPKRAVIEGDLHGSAAYKKQLIRVYLQRTLHEARGAIH
jgi:carbon-monoxide dehydrogenase medium subunit